MPWSIRDRRDAARARRARGGKSGLLRDAARDERCSRHQIVGAAREKGLVLGIGHERRFEPAMEEALTILSSGRRGKQLHMEANVSHDGFAKIPPETGATVPQMRLLVQ